MAFFSILIPIYNKEKYLEDCLNSVFNQSFQDNEVVLSDDGSTDSCAVFCDEQAMCHNNVITVHKKNQGLMMTRRCGFKYARSHYYICLDSDDYFNDAEALRMIFNMLRDDSCDVVQYELVNTSNEGKITNNHYFDKPNGYCFNDIKEYREIFCKENINSIVSRAVSKEIIDIDCDYSKWQSAICRGEDVFQSIIIIDNAKRVKYLKKPIYTYRMNDDNISSNPKIDFFDAYREIYSRLEEHYVKWGIDKEIVAFNYRNQAHHLAKLLVCLWRKAETKYDKNHWKEYIRNLRDDSFTKNYYLKSRKYNTHKFDNYVLLGASHGWPAFIICIYALQRIKMRALGQMSEQIEYY